MTFSCHGALSGDTPYELDPSAANIVLNSIRQNCERRQWNLITAQVRDNSVYVIVDSPTSAAVALRYLKACATLALAAWDGRREVRRWERHGSASRIESTRALRLAFEFMRRQTA